MKQAKFTKVLVEWNERQQRPMPWKGEKNPYLIWLSEIILQQTRVVQGLPYFEKFKAAFPTVHDLANAQEDEVMKLWEGLGYYSRARNLHGTAQYISSELKGIFPKEHKHLLALKGIGPYTAAAIASFAFDLPHAVVDGNVYRVLSRVFNIADPIDSTEGKTRFSTLANTLLDKKQPGIYNQAIMDFGATICLPKNPNCRDCPLQKICEAYAKNNIEVLPVKSKKLIRKKRFFNYLVVRDKQHATWIGKRTGKDIWQNLYEFPMIETEGLISKEELIKRKEWKTWMAGKKMELWPSKPFRQILTHQEIVAVFWEIKMDVLEPLPTHQPYAMIQWEELERLAFPKIIDAYLKDSTLYLRL